MTLWLFVISRQFSANMHIYSSMSGKNKWERAFRIQSLSCS